MTELPPRSGPARAVGATVCAVRAIRRFTVRTVLPENLRALEELAINLRWSWHPATRDLFAAVDPELWDEGGHDPVRLLGEVSAERLAALSADPSFVEWADRCRDDLRRLPGVGPLVPVAGPGRARRHRVLLAGVRHRVGAPAVLRGPGHPRRRPPEDRQRPRRADHRDRPVLPVGLLQAVAVARRLAAGALPGHGSRRQPRVAAARGRTAAPPRWPSACPAAGSSPPASGSPRSVASRCSCSTPTSRRTARPSARSPTGCTAAAASTASSRRCCSASAASARCAPTAASRGHAGAGGVPHQRGPRRLPRPRAHPRAGVREPAHDLRRGARGRARGDGLHDPHARSGRHRPLPDRPDRPALRRRQRLARRARRPHPRARSRDLRGRRPGRVQHGRHGPAPGPARQRREPAARPRVPRDVRRAVVRVRQRRRADHLDHQRRARADMGRAAGPRPRPRGLDRRRRGLGSHRRRPRRPALGDQARPASGPRRHGPLHAARVVGQPRLHRRRAGLDRHRSRSRRADDRLRPPGAVLQAADADAARSGPPARRCSPIPSARCSSSWPARRTPPTTAASG